jgi:hypothetical protein
MHTWYKQCLLGLEILSEAYLYLKDLFSTTINVGEDVGKKEPS